MNSPCFFQLSGKAKSAVGCSSAAEVSQRLSGEGQGDRREVVRRQSELRTQKLAHARQACHTEGEPRERWTVLQNLQIG